MEERVHCSGLLGRQIGRTKCRSNFIQRRFRLPSLLPRTQSLLRNLLTRSRSNREDSKNRWTKQLCDCFYAAVGQLWLISAKNKTMFEKLQIATQLARLENLYNCKDYMAQQVGFCAQWLLDNICKALISGLCFILALSCSVLCSFEAEQTVHVRSGA